MPGLLRASDVVIIPSLRDGLPNLANEAQACGRPVLGSDAGGIPESVQHLKTGKIFKNGDSALLGEEMIWFYRNQDKIPIMGSQARKHMIDNFSWDETTREMLALFETARINYEHRSLMDHHA
jgi:glycosyltransferase involved in cell wall biosynthesis